MGFLRNSMVGHNSVGLRIDYLIVAGGAGGQTGAAFATDGGAGAGGDVVQGSILLPRGFFNSVSIGQAGTDGGPTSGTPGNQGTRTFIGGVAITSSNIGLGGGYNLSGVQTYGWGGPSAGFGGGQPGLGFSHSGEANKAGGAGGGAGGSASGATPGVGVVSSISGASVEYGRGGIVKQNNFIIQPPGTGGFGGWGGSTSTSTQRGTNGFAGIAIIRYPAGNGQLRMTGGTFTNLGGYIIHTFTSNDNIFVIP